MTPLGEAERVNDVVLFALGRMGFKTESSPKYRQKYSHSNVSSTHRPEEDDIPPLVAIITAFQSLYFDLVGILIFVNAKGVRDVVVVQVFHHDIILAPRGGVSWYSAWRP